MAEGSLSSPSNTSLTTITPTNTSNRPAQSLLSTAHHFLTLKLTQTNFLFWKTPLLPFLHGQSLIGFIDGTRPCPPAEISVEGKTEPEPNPDYLTWIQQDQCLMSLIISSLSEDVIP